MTWSSLHAFYHADRAVMDRLLLDCIRPAVDRVLGDKLVTAWFFIRYWEGGPHIRLRLRDADEATVRAVEDELRAYLAGHPASSPAPDPGAFYASVTAESDPVKQHGWSASGEVRAVPYEPETARYGGPTGLAISEALFQASSRVALAVIQMTPNPQKRLLVALQLLLAVVQSIELPDLEAVGWLRMSVNLFPQMTPISVEQSWRACNAAEGEFIAKEKTWLELRGRNFLAGSADKPNVISSWASAVRESFALYRDAEASGELTAPPLVILLSQLHMLHNRLGLTIPEECYVEWLASLILARPELHASFAADSLTAHDRLYHEQSKLFPYLLGEQMAQASKPEVLSPPRVSSAPLARRIALTRPEAPNETVRQLEKVLLARRSEFRAYGGKLDAGELALLLELSVGRVPTEYLELDGQRIERKRRTHPSGGGRYPILTYVLPYNVEGVPRALYWFDVEEHALEQVAGAPPIDALLLSSQMLSTLDDTPVVVQARDAPVWIFPVADLTYQRKRYGLRSYRLVLNECGHMAQNICLVATALELTSITIGGYFDDLLNHTLGLDGVNRAALYMIPIGKPS